MEYVIIVHFLDVVYDLGKQTDDKQVVEPQEHGIVEELMDD